MMSCHRSQKFIVTPAPAAWPARATPQGNQKERTGLAVLIILVLTTAPVYGEYLPRIDPSGRSGEPRQDLLKEELPPPPASLSVPAPPAPEKQPMAKPGVYVRKIKVTGSTVFSAQELGAVTTAYENRILTMEDLEACRRALTLLYVNGGYVSSGAVIPDQTVRDGTITCQVIEGTLTRIDVEGNQWFAAGYLKDRIALGAATPVNVVALQNRLQLLQQDQRLARINAELRPGSRLGESELAVKVEEKPPLSATLAFNNYQSPSVGSERGLFTLAHQNLTGHADVLSLTYGRSEGLNPMLDFWYDTPINRYDTAIHMRYRRNDFSVVDSTFDPLDIDNNSVIYEIGLRQPMLRTLNEELDWVISIEHERSRTYLLDEPFSFYPGVEDGESIVNPLRFTQEWTYRTQRQAFAVRSQFSYGLSWNKTTTNHEDLPDGLFIAWLGQFQWARITSLYDTQLLFRTDVQLATDALLPLEQISVGGRYSVRGYRENLLVADQGVITSLEARILVIRNKVWADTVQLCPFYDYGLADNKLADAGGSEDIASIGMGVRWAKTLNGKASSLKAETEFYWAHPFTHVDLPNDDIQDQGIHFQVALTGFF